MIKKMHKEIFNNLSDRNWKLNEPAGHYTIWCNSAHNGEGFRVTFRKYYNNTGFVTTISDHDDSSSCTWKPGEEPGFFNEIISKMEAEKENQALMSEIKFLDSIKKLTKSSFTPYERTLNKHRKEILRTNLAEWSVVDGPLPDNTNNNILHYYCSSSDIKMVFSDDEVITSFVFNKNKYTTVVWCKDEKDIYGFFEEMSQNIDEKKT